MAKQTPGNGGRSDPKKNKSLAIRIVLKRMPGAKAAEVAAAVRKEFGHHVGQNMVYMVKTKRNMASDGRPKRRRSDPRDNPMTTAALWVEAIKMARQLLKATGSVPNATALLKALDGQVATKAEMQKVTIMRKTDNCEVVTGNNPTVRAFEADEDLDDEELDTEEEPDLDDEDEDGDEEDDLDDEEDFDDEDDDLDDDDENDDGDDEEDEDDSEDEGEGEVPEAAATVESETRRRQSERVD